MSRSTAKMQVVPTHHQMVRSLWGRLGNMEQLSRKSEVPVNSLWRAFKNQNTKLTGGARALEKYYYEQFPNHHFSQFFARKDEKLQNAFQLAVADKGADKTILRELLEDDWTWLSTWSYDADKSAEHYLRARYALMAGWTNIPLGTLNQGVGGTSAHLRSPAPIIAGPTLLKLRPATSSLPRQSSPRSILIFIRPTTPIY
jgi:hypothetical protein